MVSVSLFFRASAVTLQLVQSWFYPPQCSHLIIAADIAHLSESFGCFRPQQLSFQSFELTISVSLFVWAAAVTLLLVRPWVPFNCCHDCTSNFQCGLNPSWDFGIMCSCPPALQHHLSSIFKSLAWLWLAPTSASSLALAQIARQLTISICCCLGVFGIVTTPPTSNRLLSAASAFGILPMRYTVSSIQWIRVSSSARFTFIYTRDCCITLMPSLMSSSSGYLLASMPISSIWRIVASCLSLRSCRRNTSICLIPALVFNKWPVQMLETHIDHHPTVILAS